ncbi:hypothetical protein U746_0770 [Mycolicibacterium mucogenicum 261Sha1.1M5]|nr:hypothetical protein U746_0770 [Mycolicibacterium mucogenicum 261Sha1.1M5]
MKKAFPKLILASCAAILLVAGAAQAARADSTNRFNLGGYLRATASYQSYGDKITVKDQRADGYWTRAELSWKGSGVKRCDAKGGSGSSKTCAFNAPEGSVVSYKVYLMKGNTYHYGSAIWKDKA